MQRLLVYLIIHPQDGTRCLLSDVSPREKGVPFMGNCMPFLEFSLNFLFCAATMTVDAERLWGSAVADPHSQRGRLSVDICLRLKGCAAAVSGFRSSGQNSAGGCRASKSVVSFFSAPCSSLRALLVGWKPSFFTRKWEEPSSGSALCVVIHFSRLFLAPSLLPCG